MQQCHICGGNWKKNWNMHHAAKGAKYNLCVYWQAFQACTINKNSLEKSLWNIFFMNAYLCMLLTIKTIRNYFKRCCLMEFKFKFSASLTMWRSLKVHPYIYNTHLKTELQEGFLHIFCAKFAWQSAWL